MIRSPMKPKKPRPKTCPFCREKYQPDPGLQVNCCHKIECRAAFIGEYTSKKREERKAAADKAEREEIRARKEKLKTVRDYLKEAQVAFNAFIRERDKDEACISCGRFHNGAWDAGHYRSVGAAPALRFDEANCHRQCVPCNQHKAGNIVEYRTRLLFRIGKKEVERLEGPLPDVKWTKEMAIAIKAKYAQKLKELKKWSATVEETTEV